MASAISEGATELITHIQDQCQKILAEEHGEPYGIISLKTMPNTTFDHLSQFLIPDKITDMMAANISGNGNCLYNAVSLALCGYQTLATCLRTLTAAELYLHSDSYAKHPLIMTLILWKTFHLIGIPVCLLH